MSGHRTETDGGSRSQAVRPASTAPTVFGAQITPRALAWARQSVDATEQPEQMKPGTSEQSFRIPTDGGPVRSSDRLPRRHRTRHQRKTSGPSPHHKSPYTETELNEQPGAPLHTQQPTQRAATHSTPKVPLHTQQSTPHPAVHSTHLAVHSTPGIRAAPQPPHPRPAVRTRTAPAPYVPYRLPALRTRHPHHTQHPTSRTRLPPPHPPVRTTPTGPHHTPRSAPPPPVRTTPPGPHHPPRSAPPPPVRTTPTGPHHTHRSAPHPVVRHPRAAVFSPHLAFRTAPGGPHPHGDPFHIPRPTRSAATENVRTTGTGGLIAHDFADDDVSLASSDRRTLPRDFLPTDHALRSRAAWAATGQGAIPNSDRHRTRRSTPRSWQIA